MKKKNEVKKEIDKNNKALSLRSLNFGLFVSKVQENNLN